VYFPEGLLRPPPALLHLPIHPRHQRYTTICYIIQWYIILYVSSRRISRIIFAASRKRFKPSTQGSSSVLEVISSPSVLLCVKCVGRYGTCSVECPTNRETIPSTTCRHRFSRRCQHSCHMSISAERCGRRVRVAVYRG